MGRYQRSGPYFSLSLVFYTQKNIKGTFHDGSEVCVENIRSGWKMRVTKAPNGQWFTLNNRMLFAYNMRKWASPIPDTHYLTDALLPSSKVQVVPFSEAKTEFFIKKTTEDNGNTCYIRGRSTKKDWICAELVNREAYYEYVLERLTPEKEQEQKNMQLGRSTKKYLIPGQRYSLEEYKEYVLERQTRQKEEEQKIRQIVVFILVVFGVYVYVYSM